MGAIVLASIQTGLVLVSAPGFLYTTIMGVIVVGAVLVNNWFSTLISRIAPMTVEEPEGDARQLIPPLQLIPLVRSRAKLPLHRR